MQCGTKTSFVVVLLVLYWTKIVLFMASKDYSFYQTIFVWLLGKRWGAFWLKDFRSTQLAIFRECNPQFFSRSATVCTRLRPRQLRILIWICYIIVLLIAWLAGRSYSDSQKHESICLLSDRFCCISPELLELQKIHLHLFISVFEELLAGTGIFQILWQNQLIFAKMSIFQ